MMAMLEIVRSRDRPKTLNLPPPPFSPPPPLRSPCPRIGSNLEQSALQVRIDVVDGSIDPSLARALFP